MNFVLCLLAAVFLILATAFFFRAVSHHQYAPLFRAEVRHALILMSVFIALFIATGIYAALR